MPTFVTQDQIDKEKIDRQKEWDRVRKPEDPEKAPEKPQNIAPVWKQLQDNKETEKFERDEAFAFKNQVWMGYDDTEADFYVAVAKHEHKMEAMRDQETANLLKEGQKFRIEEAHKLTYQKEMAKVNVEMSKKNFENRQVTKKRSAPNGLVKLKQPVSKKKVLLEYSSSSSDSE